MGRRLLRRQTEIAERNQKRYDGDDEQLVEIEHGLQVLPGTDASRETPQKQRDSNDADLIPNGHRRQHLQELQQNPVSEKLTVRTGPAFGKMRRRRPSEFDVRRLFQQLSVPARLVAFHFNPV